MQERCITCRFWQLLAGKAGKEYGLCRYNAPPVELVETEGEARAAVWPITEANDWCGRCEMKSES
jgi:hypothetical protein